MAELIDDSEQTNFYQQNMNQHATNDNNPNISSISLQELIQPGKKHTPELNEFPHSETTHASHFTTAVNPTEDQTYLDFDVDQETWQQMI